jgi:hypothetical protein
VTTTTTDQQLTLPSNTDLNDIPTAAANIILGLSNNGVESRLVKRYLSVADRAARNPTPNEGEFSYLLDQNELDSYDGAAWQYVWSAHAPRGIIVAPTTSGSNGTATSGGTETLDTVLGTYSFTAVTGRRYEVHYNNCKINASVADDLYEFRIRNGGASTPTALSALVAAFAVGVHVNGGTGQVGANVLGTFVPGAGVVTLGVFLVRIAGSGVGTPIAPTAGILRELYAVDIGNV